MSGTLRCRCLGFCCRDRSKIGFCREFVRVGCVVAGGGPGVGRFCETLVTGFSTLRVHRARRWSSGSFVPSIPPFSEVFVPHPGLVSLDLVLSPELRRPCPRPLVPLVPSRVVAAAPDGPPVPAGGPLFSSRGRNCRSHGLGAVQGICPGWLRGGRGWARGWPFL